jgi:transcriptional regulator with XRE-family HTH domain
MTRAMTTGHSLTFGALLKNHRRALRLTQEKLAERAGYSPSYVSQLERGERLPTAATVELLARALGLSADEGAALAAAARRSVSPPPEHAARGGSPRDSAAHPEQPARNAPPPQRHGHLPVH